MTVATIGCGSSPQDVSDTTWVGTITTQGNVTTVVNEWSQRIVPTLLLSLVAIGCAAPGGGTATLVEEASIGVESGTYEYRFGRVAAVMAQVRRSSR